LHKTKEEESTVYEHGYQLYEASFTDILNLQTYMLVEPTKSSNPLSNLH
jgi:hypothetical protein